MDKLSIALADDHPTLLRGVEALFAEDERFTVVGTGNSAEQAVELVVRFEPAILLIDLSMPGDVYSAIAEVRRQSPQTKVIVFTAYANVSFATQAFDCGAHAFVLKGRPIGDLYDAFEAAYAEEIYVSPGFAELVDATKSLGRGKHRGVPHLSKRERQLVDRLYQGKSNREIADDLNLSEKTIKHYMSNLMQKLGVKSRLEVVLKLQGPGDAQNRGDGATGGSE